MSLTLGLNTALSGLMTNQRGLDVVSQNIVNVNTKGYTRKVLNTESRILAGSGAGVQEASLTRTVDEGLMKDIRAQASKLSNYEALLTYYPRIEDQFGKVGDTNSVSHTLESLSTAFEGLATEADKPNQQWSSVQAAMDATSKLSDLTDQLQSLRLQADREIESTVTLVNESLTNIADLNNKIMRNEAIGASSADLRDQRDTELSTLAGYMDITYYERGDGSMMVYSASGRTLVDSGPAQLSHTATTVTDASQTKAGGNYNGIIIDRGKADITSEIGDGKLRALIDMRDTVLPNLQANMDELALKMKDAINQVHNRGTIMPAMANSFSGTRAFAQQGYVANGTDTAGTLYLDDGTSIATGTGGVGGLGFGTLRFDNTNASVPYKATIRTSTAGALGGTALAVGHTFSIAGSTDPRNDGTYKVVAVNGDTLTVEKANPRQTIQLGGKDDVMVALFDSQGVQSNALDLRTIMQQDYSANWTSTDARGADDFESKSTSGPWSINEVAAHVEGWLRANGASGATVGLNAQGKLDIKLNTNSLSLAFRDQTGPNAGDAATDATIKFDVDGDGNADETVKGFSNFFGLNDFFTAEKQNSITDSTILDGDWRAPQQRTMRILDSTGQLGSAIVVPAGTTLSDIAKQINANTLVTESVQIASPKLTLTSAVSFNVTDSTGQVVGQQTFNAGQIDLNQVAGALTNTGMKAEVVQDGSGYRLRMYSTAGRPLTCQVSGGQMQGSADTLSTKLAMSQSERIHASVVPEGSGYRLRITNTSDKEVFVAADPDVAGNSILTDMGLHHAATRMAESIQLRTDLQGAPERISRGTVQWNADLNQYYLSKGDNTTAMQLADAMNTKQSMATAGGIYAGSYTAAEYAAASIAVVAGQVSHTQDLHDYQSTLNQSLDSQYSSLSGVNLDEEMSKMIDFQQAYTASAKVISTLKDMLEELVNIVR